MCKNQIHNILSKPDSGETSKQEIGNPILIKVTKETTEVVLVKIRASRAVTSDKISWTEWMILGNDGL